MTEEDNKRTKTVWEGLRRKAENLSTLLSLASKQNYEKFSAAAEFSLTSQMSAAALQIVASRFPKT